MIGIYAIKNKINGRLYIGQSVNIEKRLQDHFFLSASKTHSKLFDSDIKLYGKEAFDKFVICECDRAELIELERHYIRTLKPEYNSVRIGDKRNDEFRNKVREGTKKWWNNLEPDTKEKIIKNNLTGPRKGHVVSKKTRELLRQANLGKKNAKPVYIVETGQVFQSAEKCAEFLNVTHSAVCYNLRGKTNKTKGYSIRYFEGVETMGDECSPVG